MAENDNDDVRRTFSYTPEERALIRAIDTYMRLVERDLDRILTDPARRRRFMLAGLFGSYRAANHQGLQLTTDPADRNAYSDDRVEAFPRLAGEDIASTAEYLRKIRFNPWRWMLRGTGRALHDFVMRG